MTQLPEALREARNASCGHVYGITDPDWPPMVACTKCRADRARAMAAALRWVEDEMPTLCDCDPGPCDSCRWRQRVLSTIAALDARSNDGGIL